MSEVIKDAPCLCKDDEMERIQPKRNFFQKILYSRLRKRNRCYLYPVLYSDRTISKAQCDRIGRKPLGIVFENHLITLKDSPQEMRWFDAMIYCRDIKIFEQPCEAGALEFWSKSICEKESNFINKTLLSLGGKPLKVHEWYWSSSEFNRYGAGFFCTNDGASQGCVDFEYKDDHFAVRPVLDFSKLPPEVAARFVWLT